MPDTSSRWKPIGQGFDEDDFEAIAADVGHLYSECTWTVFLEFGNDKITRGLRLWAIAPKPFSAPGEVAPFPV